MYLTGLPIYRFTFIFCIYCTLFFKPECLHAHRDETVVLRLVFCYTFVVTRCVWRSGVLLMLK